MVSRGSWAMSGRYGLWPPLGRAPGEGGGRGSGGGAGWSSFSGLGFGVVDFPAEPLVKFGGGILWWNFGGLPDLVFFTGETHPGKKLH